MSVSFLSKIEIGKLKNTKQECYPPHPQRQIC